MWVRAQFSLGRKLVLTMMATSSASLLIACLSFLSYDVVTFRRNVADHLKILADMTGSNVAAALTYHDPKSANLVLGALKAEPHILAARVYRIDGSTFASYSRDPGNPEDHLPAHAPAKGLLLNSVRVTNCQPVIFDEDLVGYVCLESDLDELEVRKHRLFLFVLILVAASSAAAFFMALLLKRFISKPIHDLVRTAKRVSTDKNYGIRSRKYADDELGLLVDGFNEMLGIIETRDADLKSEVTFRIRAEQTLRESETRLQLLLDSTAEAIYGIDREGRCTFTNRACLQTLGYEDPGDLLGKNMHSLIHHTRPDGAAYPLEECPTYLTIISGHPGHVDQDTLWKADKTSFPVEAWAHPVWKDGQLAGGVVTFIDITERLRSQTALQAAHAESELFINSVPSILIGLDDEGRIIRWNSAAAGTFRLNEGDVLGKSLETCGIQWMDRGMKEKLRSLQTMTSQGKWDDVLFQKEGKQRLLGLTATKIGSAETGDVMFLIVGADITERKHNEEAVRQLSLAVEQSPVSVLITDLEGSITYVNGRFSEASGYRREEVLGQNPRILKSEHTTTAEYKQMWESITQGKEWRGEFHNKKKNGELYWENVVISPIKDNNGNPTHFLAIKEDVTEQKNRETQLRQTQKLEAIGQLAAGIAHEINTPIQFVGDNTRFVREAWISLLPLIAALQSLCRPAPDPASQAESRCELNALVEGIDLDYLRQEIPEALEQSLEGIARVAKIVQAMKEFSHPGSDEKQFADINKAIQTTLTVARNEWKYVADVEMDLASDLELIPCHVSEFNQVILNLLVNSAHAIAQALGDGSSGKGKITIQTKQDADWATISLQDTGAGIPMEIRSRIFEPFFTTKAVGKGTGQGLALAHTTIVKKHGGRLWFESEVGKGTTFYIQLPLAKSATRP